MPQMKKKSEKKSKRMMPMSPRPMERPELDDSDAAGAVRRGNRAARRYADEYEGLMGNYRDGGMVRGCKPVQATGKGFRGAF